MELPLYKYLKPKQVEYIMNRQSHHFPNLHYWRKGNDFGLKYEFIKLRNLKADLRKKKAIETKGEIDEEEAVFLIQTAKGYSLSGLHGYNRHFELVETIKYAGLWWDKPDEWKKIAKETSLR